MKKIYFYEGNGSGSRNIGAFNLEDENNTTTDNDIEAIRLMIEKLFLYNEESKECETEVETNEFIINYPNGDDVPFKNRIPIHYFHSNFVLPIKLYEMLKQEWEKSTGIIKPGKFELDLGEHTIYKTHSMCMSEDKDILFDYDEMLTREYQDYSFNRTSR